MLPMLERLHVALNSSENSKTTKRGYDIIVGERLLAKAGEYISPLIKGKNVIIISDSNVSRFYLHRLSNTLEEAKIRFRCLIIPAGEASKSLPSYAKLMEDLLEQKPDRRTTLIALGGGVVGDLTGFAASTLLRGVDFIQIPTTLLSQVDSSVGGKTGINSRFGKNLIGSFHQPILVLTDVATLTTLPQRELLSGYAEMVKYGFINDQFFFNWLTENAAQMLAGDAVLQTQAIVKSCAAKADIVAADEKEQNIRALLNFGHTFAHAFEAETGYSEKLLHGEAVAIGMVLAFATSVKMGLCPPADLQQVIAHLQTVGLPVSPLDIRLDWNIDALMEHFTHDKKTVDGALTFVLAHGIGKAFIKNDVNASIIREVLQETINRE
jgi:3-dehydroquinate synthase